MTTAGAEHPVDRLPFDSGLARLLPLADLVMIVMISRPPSGSLRTTRVTAATIGLAAVVAVAALGAAAIAILRALSAAPLWLIALAFALAAAISCADLALYGVRQRILLSARRP